MFTNRNPLFQILREEKDVVGESELERASEGLKGIKQKFSRHRPKSIGDTMEMGQPGGQGGSTLAPPPCALSTPPPSATPATVLEEAMDTQ